MAVTYTARTKATMARATNATSTTGSTTYVDMTGITLSAENNYYYSAYWLGKQAASGTTDVKLVENVTDKETISFPDLGVSTHYHVGWFNKFQNVSGSTQTVKLQWKTNTGTATTLAATFLYKMSNNNVTENFAFFKGNLHRIPIKISLTSIDFFGGSIGYGQAVNNNSFNVGRRGVALKLVAEATIKHFIVIDCAGTYFHNNQDNEHFADTFATATPNNIVTDGLTFIGKDANWQKFFNEDVTTPSNGADGFLILIYDWTGTQITVTP